MRPEAHEKRPHDSTRRPIRVLRKMVKRDPLNREREGPPPVFRIASGADSASAIPMEQDADPIEAFITRWETAEASERSNAPMFLTELCDLLGLDHPDPAGGDHAYVFERDVTFRKVDGSTANGRIDLYKRGCFVLEAKQGAHDSSAKVGHGRRGTPAWEQAMIRARNQADRYVRALPADEGRPPFVLVVDVGHSIELYAEFSRSGGTYVAFPSPGSHRISLSDLRMDE